MTVDWYMNEAGSGLPDLRAPQPPSDMELYLTNNSYNYAVQDPMFPGPPDGQNNFLQYLMSGSNESSTNTTPSDIVALNSPNVPSPSTATNSPRTTPLPQQVPGPPMVTPVQGPMSQLQSPLPRKNPEEAGECRWVDQNTRQVCGMKFSEVSALGQHINSQHVKETPFLCWWENCKNANHPFSRKYKLIYHIRTHTKEKPHKCTECPKQFTRIESYNSHKKTHMKQHVVSNPPSPAPNAPAQGGMTSSVLHLSAPHQCPSSVTHNIHQPPQQSQQPPPHSSMNVIMSSTVVPGGQMLQNGQLMGPITIMTQPNNFANTKSPPPSQTLPPTSGSTANTPPNNGQQEASPKIKTEVSSQEQDVGMLNNMSPSSGGMVYSQAQYQYSSAGLPPAMSRPPSVTPAETPNMTVNPPHLGPMSGLLHGHPGVPPHPGVQGNPRFGHQMLRQKMLSQQQHQQMQQQGYNVLQQNMHLVSLPHNMAPGQNIKPYPGAVQQQPPPPKVKPSPQMRNGQSPLSQPNSPANNAMSPHLKTSPGIKTSASPSNLVGSPKMNISSNQKLQPDMNNSSPVMSSPQISQPSNHMSQPSNHMSHPGGQMPMASEQLSHPSPQLSHQSPQLPHHQSPQMSHPTVQMSHPSTQIPHPTNQMSHPNAQMSHPQMSHPGSLQHLPGGDGRMLGMRPHLGHHPGLPPNHMMGGIMGQHPPMYMNMISQPHPRPTPPPTSNNRATSTQKGKNNVSVICPICNKIYTNRKALRKHIKGTTCGKSVTDIDKAMDEARETTNDTSSADPRLSGADPRLSGAAQSGSYPGQYGGVMGGYSEQYKRMRYDQTYQDQLARQQQQQYYIVPMQQQQAAQQQQQQPRPMYPNQPQPGMMMGHLGHPPPSHMNLGGPTPPPSHMAPTPPPAQHLLMNSQSSLYPSDSDLAKTSSPVGRSPGLMSQPSDNSPLSPIKRTSEPNFTALLTDPSMDNLFDWSWDPNNISKT